MKKTILLTFVLACLTGYAVDPPAHGGEKGGAPEWMKLTVPNENHKALDAFVGKWNFDMQWWMAADAKPETSKGKSTMKWIMGGRFLQSNVTSKMGKQPFEGMGLTGYDSVRGEYQAMWVDNMSTHMMTGTGKFDVATKTYTENGEFACAMTGNKSRAYRSEMKMPTKDEILHTMWTAGADGKEYKSMEIAYKRAK